MASLFQASIADCSRAFSFQESYTSGVCSMVPLWIAILARRNFPRTRSRNIRSFRLFRASSSPNSATSRSNRSRISTFIWTQSNSFAIFNGVITFRDALSGAESGFNRSAYQRGIQTKRSIHSSASLAFQIRRRSSIASAIEIPPRRRTTPGLLAERMWC